jgi:hypothetical protein
LTGKSRSTLYRQKRAKKELAKDGFHSLPDYMALMEKKSQGVHSQGRGTTCTHNVPIVAEKEDEEDEEEGDNELPSSLVKGQGECPTYTHDISRITEDGLSDRESPSSDMNGQDIYPTCMCSIPCISEERRSEELPSSLVNDHDTHPSRACHIPGGAKEEEEEGSNEDVPTTIAMLWSGLVGPYDPVLTILCLHPYLRVTTSWLSGLTACSIVPLYFRPVLLSRRSQSLSFSHIIVF